MTLSIEPSGQSCGALLRGVDLSRPLTEAQHRAIRQAWLTHQVIAFPDQSLSIGDLERYAPSIGPFGQDPFIAPLADHPQVIEVRREADETTPLFAEGWHSDWSFLPSPPAGTLLYGHIIPPVGGDTLFANQYLAWDELPAALRTPIEGRQGVHSARRGYSRAGLYGDKDAGRSMAIRPDDSARATQLHPIGRRHPETGRTALFVSPGYTIGIEGMPEAESTPLLKAIFQHQAQPAFVYRHRWSAGMLTLWDNRCVVHAATGGYQGHRRLLHRITIAERTALS
jgi:taurine dioxygenase